MVKMNIHEHWTGVTRFNPLWVSDFIHFLFSLQTSAASTFSKLCQPLKGQLRRTADKNLSQTVLVKQ